MISAEGDGAHLLHQIELEGNQVELYIKKPYHRKTWEGLIPKTNKIEPTPDTVIIFDTVGMGKIASELKDAGFPVIGGSIFADKLEQDRLFGLQFMEQAGIKVPFTVSFDEFSVDEVRKFVEEHGENKKYVFKPSGSDLPCFLTYCASDSEDLIKWVEYVDKYFAKKIDSFVLQEFKEGVCVSTEMWCDGKKFLRPANHTVETKKFLNGELGQATGCSGNLVWFEHDESCRIVQEGILRVEKQVVESGYVGPIDLNAVANEEGIFGLEFTSRMGYDSMPTLIKMIDGVGKFMSDIARGQGGTMQLKEGFAGSIRLTIPPYPLETTTPQEGQEVAPNVGVPIRGIPPDRDENFYWFEIMEEDDELVHAPGMGVIAAIVGFGDDPYEAFDEPYEIADLLQVPNKQYRTDLDRVLGDMQEQVEEQEQSSIGELVE